SSVPGWRSKSTSAWSNECPDDPIADCQTTSRLPRVAALRESPQVSAAELPPSLHLAKAANCHMCGSHHYVWWPARSLSAGPGGSVDSRIVLRTDAVVRPGILQGCSGQVARVERSVVRLVVRVQGVAGQRVPGRVDVEQNPVGAVPLCRVARHR